MAISININSASFDHGSNVIGTVHEAENAAPDTAILDELSQIRGMLQESESLIQAINCLEQAIREQNKPKVSKVIQELSGNFSSALFANLASAGLLAFLGI